jgi:hypothetical protein
VTPTGARRGRSLCSVVVVGIAVVATGCGLSDGDAQRHRVEAATCASMLARLGEPVDEITPERFAEVLAELRAGGRPYSTVQPFLRACRSFG